MIAEMGRRDPFDGLDLLANLEDRYRYAADELRVALAWTRRSAEATQCYADTLVYDLPQVHAALAAGQIDPAKARVFERHLLNLAPDQIETICARLLPLPGQLTTGQLAARLTRMVIAIDPARARDEYEHALSQRAVIAYLNPDGTVTLTAQGLPPDEAPAACERIHLLAMRVKRAGHPATLDQIKADVMLAMLNRHFEGLTAEQIVSALVGPANPAAAGTPETASNPAAPHQADGTDATARPPTGTRRPGNERLAGVQVSVELTTLLGHDEHPATLPGLGPILADVARRIVSRQRGGEWRYTIVDDAGHFHWAGFSRRRPDGVMDATEGGLVDLLIPATVLAELAANPELAGAWNDLVTDIARQYRDRGQSIGEMNATPDRRSPTASLRRHTEQRDRTCKGPGCRRPARTAQYDHTWEYRYHGATTSSNGGSFCEHDHDLKTKGGWELDQPEPGEFTWYTPLGQTHRTRGEPILYPLPSPVAPVADPPPF